MVDAALPWLLLACLPALWFLLDKIRCNLANRRLRCVAEKAWQAGKDKELPERGASFWRNVHSGMRMHLLATGSETWCVTLSESGLRKPASFEYNVSTRRVRELIDEHKLSLNCFRL